MIVFFKPRLKLVQKILPRFNSEKSNVNVTSVNFLEAK